MPASSQKRRSRRWSLQAGFDVPTFVHVLRYGVLFYTGNIDSYDRSMLPEFWPPRKRDFLKAKAVGGAMAH